jgi:hypothetical protein
MNKKEQILVKTIDTLKLIKVKAKKRYFQLMEVTDQLLQILCHRKMV